MLPPVIDMNEGLLHPPSPFLTTSMPVPYLPPRINPALMTLGIIAMPLAFPRRAGGMPVSGMASMALRTSIESWSV
jgi:hypothetical protein